MAAFRAGPGTPELSAALATRCASDRAKEHATSPVRRARAARRPPDPAVARTAQDERSRVPRLAAVRAGRAAVPAADGAVTAGTRKAARTALQALSGSIIVRVAHFPPEALGGSRRCVVPATALRISSLPLSIRPRQPGKRFDVAIDPRFL